MKHWIRRALILMVVLIVTIMVSAQTPDEAYDAAITAQVNGDIEGAIEQISTAIEAVTDAGEEVPADFYALRGELLLTANRNAEAIQDLTQVITADAATAETYLQRAQAYRELGDLSAGADYDAAVSANTNTETLLARADYLRFQGDFDAALADFDTVQAEDAENPALYRTRALLYRDQGDITRALRDANRAVELAPDDAQNYVTRGLLFQAAGDINRAGANFQAAIDVDDQSALGYLYLANLKGATGNALGALVDFERAEELDPYNPDLYFIRANLLGVLQEYTSAVEDLTRALELRPDTVRYYVARGDAHRLQAVFAAQTSFRDIVEENIAAAIEDYTTAIELDETFVLAWYGRALTYLEIEDLSSALADLEQLVAIAPPEDVPDGVPTVIEQLREQIP